MSDEILKLKEEEKLAVWDEESVEKEDQGVRHSWGKSEGWTGGLILIGIGLFFLLGRYMSFPFLGQWWALFLFVPGVVKLVGAARGDRGDLGGGLVLTFLGTMFLFNLSWSLLWPIMFVLIGVGLLLGRK